VRRTDGDPDVVANVSATRVPVTQTLVNVGAPEDLLALSATFLAVRDSTASTANKHVPRVIQVMAPVITEQEFASVPQASLVLYAVNPVRLEPMEGDVWDFVHVKMEENAIMCLDNAGVLEDGRGQIVLYHVQMESLDQIVFMIATATMEPRVTP